MRGSPSRVDRRAALVAALVAVLFGGLGTVLLWPLATAGGTYILVEVPQEWTLEPGETEEEWFAARRQPSFYSPSLVEVREAGTGRVREANLYAPVVVGTPVHARTDVVPNEIAEPPGALWVLPLALGAVVAVLAYLMTAALLGKRGWLEDDHVRYQER